MAERFCICYGMSPGEHSRACPAYGPDPEETIARLREQLAEAHAWREKHLDSLRECMAERDAARAALAESRFRPMGDNHHNAAECPYCADPPENTANRKPAAEHNHPRSGPGMYVRNAPCPACESTKAAIRALSEKP